MLYEIFKERHISTFKLYAFSQTSDIRPNSLHKFTEPNMADGK